MPDLEPQLGVLPQVHHDADPKQPEAKRARIEPSKKVDDVTVAPSNVKCLDESDGSYADESEGSYADESEGSYADESDDEASTDEQQLNRAKVLARYRDFHERQDRSSAQLVWKALNVVEPDSAHQDPTLYCADEKWCSCTEHALIYRHTSKSRSVRYSGAYESSRIVGQDNSQVADESAMVSGIFCLHSLLTSAYFEVIFKQDGLNALNPWFVLEDDCSELADIASKTAQDRDTPHTVVLLAKPLTAAFHALGELFESSTNKEHLSELIIKEVMQRKRAESAEPSSHGDISTTLLSMLVATHWLQFEQPPVAYQSENEKWVHSTLCAALHQSLAHSMESTSRWRSSLLSREQSILAAQAIVPIISHTSQSGAYPVSCASSVVCMAMLPLLLDDPTLNSGGWGSIFPVDEIEFLSRELFNTLLRMGENLHALGDRARISSLSAHDYPEAEMMARLCASLDDIPDIYSLSYACSYMGGYDDRMLSALATIVPGVHTALRHIMAARKKKDR
jgi:hypothetical protein